MKQGGITCCDRLRNLFPLKMGRLLIPLFNSPLSNRSKAASFYQRRIFLRSKSSVLFGYVAGG